jgi:hypothetical protein
MLRFNLCSPKEDSKTQIQVQIVHVGRIGSSGGKVGRGDKEGRARVCVRS